LLQFSRSWIPGLLKRPSRAMPGINSDVVAAAGLIVSGVGLGGVLVSLGFLGARSVDDAPIGGGSGRGRRRRVRRAVEEEDDDDVAESLPGRRKAAAAAAPEPQDIIGVGFSMEQAREMADSGQALAMKRTPAEVLAELQRGNARFWTGQATRPEKSAFERRALISKQFPSTAILSCSDSRVPIEIVFDQGLGDMFVIRVAGNCLDSTTHASLQYAVNHLKVKVLIVMGHEGCGAVKAAQLPLDAINKEPESLGTLLKGMRRGLEAADIASIQDVKAQDREAVTTNVKVQVEALVRDQGIMAKVRGGELIMLGAFYEISSGIVDFFHEVSGQQDHTPAIQRAPSTGVLTRMPKERIFDSQGFEAAEDGPSTRSRVPLTPIRLAAGGA